MANAQLARLEQGSNAIQEDILALDARVTLLRKRLGRVGGKVLTTLRQQHV